ncbi:MAG: B12-binding domain-containing radical SAM protein [Lentimicrobiaceae bacterium]|nr:B12-binding domain-containing radical SAM protein [Lentimicrobiaceae bacterium]
MKILLINPPRSPENRILEYAPSEAKHFIHKKLIGPPLGLLTVAAAVADHDITFIDLKGEYDLVPETPPLAQVVTNLMESVKPDVVAVTFIASEFYFGLEIFRTAKQCNLEVLTVAGGLHATLCPMDFDFPYVDILCTGQAAGIFRQVIQAKEFQKNFNSIGGIWLHTENGWQPSTAPPAAWNAATENFLFPDRNLLKRWISTYVVGGSPFASTYLFTSLGCPYKCTFCSIWVQFKGCFFQRKVESIITELKSIEDYGVVRFADANTIVNPGFINHLVDRILEEGIQKTYIMDIRFDTAVHYPYLIEKLAKAGLKVVICGFESFRQEELKKYNKNADARLIEQAISIFHANGIMLRGNYVIPPDYTPDDFAALAEYASHHQVVYAGYTILSPMPGTVYYEEVKDKIIDFDLSRYNFFNSVMKTTLPPEKFYENVGSLWLIKKGKDVI